MIALLRSEFPKAFGQARSVRTAIRASGRPADQGPSPRTTTRCRTDLVRGRGSPNGLANRVHDRSDGYVWEMFGPDHVHYVPLRAMTPPGAHNLVAAGRCMDGDAAALSSVR